MSFMHSITAALTIAGAAAFLSAGTAAAAGPKKTHILAIGACPDWKVIEGEPEMTRKMKESCQKDVDAMVSGIKKALAVEDGNVMTLVDEQATSKGVREAFIELDKHEKKNDRVVIYVNAHGGNVDVDYNGYDIKDEVLAFYTKEEPEDFFDATRRGDWMPMKTMRDLLNEMEAEEIIVIFEVCEVGGGLKNFRYNFARRQEREWRGREAIIFTSRGDQSATFNEDGTLALFTETFSNMLKNVSSGNIRDVFEDAAVETTRSRRATCMKDENLELFDNAFIYLTACTQHPSVYDPYGLMDDVHIGGATVASRWHELQNRPPAETKASSKTDEDPFAWAEPFMGQQSSVQQPGMMPAGPYTTPY